MPVSGCSASQCYDVPEAPTFRPTEVEFADPLAYIAAIRPEAEQYGACKIIPPWSWRPPFALDRKAFRFKTRVQSVHELQERSSAEDAFEEDYLAWLKEMNRTWKGHPLVNSREVDLFRLFKAVGRRGGYDKVSEQRAWKDVCKALQVRDKNGNAGYVVRQLYQKHLLGFEDRRSKQPESSRPLAANAGAMEAANSYERIVAAAKGEVDIELLGAVAVLMDVPCETAAATRPKPDLAEVGETKPSVRIPGNIHTMVCELCQGGHREDQIILCDKCDRGCHTFCLQPPLPRIPEGSWICPLCVAEEADTRAFREGKDYTLDQFEELARDFKADWFGSHSAAEQATLEEIEAAFWNVVENAEEPVEVMYGADIDTSISGSGFPVSNPNGTLPETPLAAQYAASPWNLNNLPRLEGSLLKHLSDGVAGVTLPWMYLGMMFSSFCWHIEDHMFYSINYNHWGDAKRWYTVPSSAAEAFEATFRTALPDLFEKQPDVLFHLVTMLSPRILQAAEVPVYSITQGAGEFVVTFPCSYHGGFNTGLNCAEAVNFAPPDWLRFGAASTERICSFRKQPVLAHAWLLLKVAQEVAQEGTSGEMARWVAKDWQRVVHEETERRFRLQRLGCFQAKRIEQEIGLFPHAKDDAQCAVCHAYLHLSGVECKCCPRRFVCMRHASKLCDCPPASWRLVYRHSLSELEVIKEKLAQSAPPDALCGSDGEDRTPAKEVVEPRPSAASPQPCSSECEPDGSKGSALEVNGRSCSSEPPGKGENGHDATLEVASSVDLQSTTLPHMPPDITLAPPIPRKRGRKANKGLSSAKRMRIDEAEYQPQVRLTRAAIKAEEEAQDTLDVLTALTGLADMADLDGSAKQSPQRNRDQYQESAAEELYPEQSPAQPSAGRMETTVARAEAVDEFDLKLAISDMKEQHRIWTERASAVFNKGGFKAADVEALVQQSQQFMWSFEDVQTGVPALVERLRGAQAWSHTVHAVLRSRPPLAEAEAVLTTKPAPIAVPGLVRFAEGVAHARLWVERATALSQEKRLLDFKTLEGFAAEGQRLPVALPELKALKERLTAARQLLEAVRAALPLEPATSQAKQEAAKAPVPPVPDKMRVRRKKPAMQGAPSQTEKAAASHSQPQDAADTIWSQMKVVEVTLEWLRILRNQAGVLKIHFAELDRLLSAITEIEAFQAKIQGVMQVKPSLPALNELMEASKTLVANVPEMQRVKTLLAEARSWLNKARNVTQSRTALKKMREVLHAGLRLGSELPEVEALRQEIRRREWEDHARKAMTNKQTMSALIEIVEEAAAMGAEHSDLGLGVRQRLDEARAWDEEASRFFASCGRAPLIALEALVDSGNALGVRMERLIQANQALNTALAWSHKAEQAVLTHKDVQAESRPTVGHLENLLAEYQGLLVALPEADSLEEKRSEASRWAQQAAAVLADGLTERDIPVYEKLVSDGWALGVQMEELGTLQDSLAALEWMSEVRKYSISGALGLQSVVSHKESAAPLDGANAAVNASTADAHATARADPVRQADAVSTAARVGPVSMDWRPTDAQDPAPAADLKLQDTEGDLEQADTQEDQLPGTPVVPSPSASVPTMTVDEAQQLVEEGKGLPVDQKVLALLQRNLDVVHEWEERLAAVSSQGLEEAAGGLAAEVVLPLVEEARDMLLQPESLPALESALAKAAVWQSRASRLFKPGQKPQYAEVAAIATTGQELLVKAEASAQVEEVVAQAEAWLEDCRKLVAKRNSGHRLGMCIEVAQSCLDMAIEQLELRRQDEADRPLPSGRVERPEVDPTDDERELYCVCQQPYHADTAMISCDSCDEWYHCRCIGLSQTAARSIKKYACPVCHALRGSSKELEQALLRTRRTRRVSADDLAGVLAEAAELPCIMPEADGLQRVLDSSKRWCRAAASMLESHALGVAAAHEEATTVRPDRPDHPAPGRPHHDTAQGGVETLVEAELPLWPEQAGKEAGGSHTESLEIAGQPHNRDGPDGPVTTVNSAGQLACGPAPGSAAAHQGSADCNQDMAEPPLTHQPGAASSPAAAPRMLTLKTLSQLLKSALSMEVSIGGLQAQIMGALKQQRWRQRVEAALTPGSRYTVEMLGKLQKEGDACGIVRDEDHWGQMLTERTSRVDSWLAEAQKVVKELTNGERDRKRISESIQKAQSLLARGRSGLGQDPAELPKGFDKELARLEEACKLYCLCQLPYNEERPMLGCDYCQGWFHYDCVGLRAPSDDEDDEDVAPKDYKCPQCCQDEGMPYPQRHKLAATSLQALGWAAWPTETPRSAAQEPGPTSSASRLHELLTPSQAQALGEAQQAMLGAAPRPVPQPAHSWLLSVLAQQQRLRPESMSGPPAIPFQHYPSGQIVDYPASCGLPGTIMMPAYQAQAGFAVPQFAQPHVQSGGAVSSAQLDSQQ